MRKTHSVRHARVKRGTCADSLGIGAAVRIGQQRNFCCRVVAWGHRASGSTVERRREDRDYNGARVRICWHGVATREHDDDGGAAGSL